MIVKTCTFEEHIKINLGSSKLFWERMYNLKWKPKIFLSWDSSDYNDEIDIWLKETKFTGRLLRSFSHQIDFEDETDAMAFKLRWS